MKAWCLFLFAGMVFLEIIGPATARAQLGDHGSRFVAVDHWAYPYIRRLRTRGYLSNLNPFIQPYRRLEVGRGLAPMDPDTLASPVSYWVRLLQTEFNREINRIGGNEVGHVGVQFKGSLTASSSQRLDPLRPTGESDAWLRYTAGLWVEWGPLAFQSRISGDQFLENDPDGLNPGQGRGGRSDNSYLSLWFSHGGLVLGRFKRNWSLPGMPGLMVSDVSTSYPQFGFEIDVGRFSLNAAIGELETLPTSAVDSLKRYLSAFRFDYKVDNLVLSFGQSFLYASSTGFQIRYLNPVEPNFFDQDKEPNDVVLNAVLEGQVWFRWRGMEFFGEGILDDFDLQPPVDDRAPARYAFALGARLPDLIPWGEIDLSFRQTSAWAYRSFRGVDDYTFLERGLGDEFIDYNRLRLAFELFPPLKGLWATPTFTFQRKGEANLGDPFPPGDEFRTQPPIFVGVVEETFRLGLAGRYQPNRFVWVAWDIGENFVQNARHVQGNNISEFTATAALGVTVELPQ